MRRRLRLVASAILLIGALPASAQLSALTLLNWEDPSYPPLARAARIEGEVEIQFRINETGNTVAVEVVAGHPVLTPLVEQTVEAWRFGVPASIDSSRTHTTRFTFSLTERPEGMSLAQGGDTKVSRDGFESVAVSASWSDVLVDDLCRSPDREDRVLPSPEDFGPGDYVELSRSSCYGSCPSYRVRLFRSGQVEWEGFGHVAISGTSRAIADPDASAALLEKITSNEFWSLCNSYSRSVTDSASILLSANIAGQHKTISDYAESGPESLHETIRRVDIVADTHRWRHGDPAAEPLSNIVREVWYGKLGITPLMEAAATGAPDRKVLDLIESADVIDQADGSGWSALMYAAAHSSNSMRLLLAAGADANYRNLRGHTPLMAAATGRAFDEELAEAGADVDAQSEDGLTALMILAAQGDPEEIGLALKAGASPLLKDSEGRTALDYLVASNCWRDPLLNPLNETWTVESDHCNALDENDFQESFDLLRKAVAAAAR